MIKIQNQKSLKPYSTQTNWRKKSTYLKILE